ncbi:MAG: hypothetical protein AAGJ35_07315, partial [Myxococcota bacterium]
ETATFGKATLRGSAKNPSLYVAHILQQDGKLVDGFVAKGRDSEGQAVAVSPDGKDVYVMGQCHEDVLFDNLTIQNRGGKSFCVAHANQNLLFQNVYTGVGGVTGQSMMLLPGKGLFVAGSFLGTVGLGPDDKDENRQVTYDAPDEGNDANGDLITGNGLFVARLRERTLEYSWGKQGVTAFAYKGDQDVVGMHVNKDGVIFLAGRFRGGNFRYHTEKQIKPKGEWDSFVVRLAPDGSFYKGPVYTVAGKQDDQLTAMAIDGQGSLYMGGFVLGATVFATSLGKPQPKWVGVSDAFVWKVPYNRLGF